MVNHVESFAQVHTKQTGPEGRFLSVESSGDVCHQGEYCRDGGVVTLKAVLRGRGDEGRFQDREVQALEDLNFRT